MRVKVIVLLAAMALAANVSLASSCCGSREGKSQTETTKLCKQHLDEALAKCPKKGQKDCPLANVKPLEKHSDCTMCNPPKKEKDEGHGGH